MVKNTRKFHTQRKPLISLMSDDDNNPNDHLPSGIPSDAFASESNNNHGAPENNADNLQIQQG